MEVDVLGLKVAAGNGEIGRECESAETRPPMQHSTGLATKCDQTLVALECSSR